MKEAYEIYDLPYRRQGHLSPKELLGQRDKKTLAAKDTWLPSDLNAPILDVGCGWGERLLSFWAAGYKNLTGVDISKVNCDICLDGLPENISIINADVFVFLKDKRDKYGLIILFDVLEHFATKESHDLLILIKDALKQNGKIIIRVPNASSLIIGYVRYGDITHQQSFTENSIMQLFEMAGFRDVEFIIQKYFDYRSWKLNRSWRRPWAGLNLRSLINDIFHHFVYILSGISPRPKMFSWHLTVKAEK